MISDALFLLLMAFSSHGAALAGATAAMLSFFLFSEHMEDDRSNDHSQNCQNNNIAKRHRFPFLYTDFYLYISILVFSNSQIHKPCQYRNRRNGEHAELRLTGNQAD